MEGLKACVFTLGCKVNETESGYIAANLEKAGFSVTTRLERADIYVLNTCAVTGEAERKSRQLVSRARRLNPDAAVYVCGCASEFSIDPYISRSVRFVCGTADKEKKILEAVSEDFSAPACFTEYPKSDKTRAFLKVSDGCNNFCSYCLIPYLRGRERSKSVDDVVKEALSSDCPEIVLNGINLSSYRDGEKDLSDLIYALRGVDARIRLGSLECNIVDERFLDAVSSLKDFAPQFHLSLQSGSDKVLRDMNRRYTREEYLAKCALIRSRFPDAGITTDIIAGYPTETDEDFRDTLSLIDEAEFSRIHCFSFSRREGSAAARLPELPASTKSERLHELLKKADERSARFVERHIGCETDFIAEQEEDGMSSGYTGNYMRVYALGAPIGKISAVRILKPYMDGAMGEILQ